jgi:hypothetical protein
MSSKLWLKEICAQSRCERLPPDVVDDVEANQSGQRERERDSDNVGVEDNTVLGRDYGFGCYLDQIRTAGHGELLRYGSVFVEDFGSKTENPRCAFLCGSCCVGAFEA